MKEYNEQVVETLDDAGYIIANKNIIIDNLQARIAELEEENARLKAESRDACLGLNDYYGRKLAAEQLNNKLLREALEAVIKVHGYESGIPVEALAQPSDTFALDAYVAEKVKDVQLQDIEQYLFSQIEMQTNEYEDMRAHARMERDVSLSPDRTA